MKIAVLLLNVVTLVAVIEADELVLLLKGAAVLFKKIAAGGAFEPCERLVELEDVVFETLEVIVLELRAVEPAFIFVALLDTLTPVEFKPEFALGGALVLVCDRIEVMDWVLEAVSVPDAVELSEPGSLKKPVGADSNG